MSTDISKREFKQLKEQLRHSMARTALLPLPNELNLRMANLLQSMKIIDGIDASELSKPTVSVLENPESDLSMAPKGPILLIKESEKNISMLEPTELVCHTDSVVRSGIITHLLVQKEAGTLKLSERTSDLLNCDDLTSSSRSVWVPAAVKLYDFLKSDFQFHLSCLKQSMLLPGNANKNAFGQFAEKVMNPSLEMLESVTPPLTKPTDKSDSIRAACKQAAQQCANLEDFLDIFFESYGFVPLLGAISAAGWVEEWTQHHKLEPSALEARLWAWAQRRRSVVAIYHVCQVLLSTAELLSESDTTQLWDTVRGMMCLGSSEENANSSECWRIRAELAQMYCKRLEVLLPNQNGEVLACSACWLAEQVGTLFDESPDTIPRFLSAVEGGLSVTENTWLMGRSKIGTSALRYSVIFQDAIWKRSLAFEIARLVKIRGVSFVPEDIRKAAVEALMRLAVEGVAKGCLEDEIVFPFAQDMQQSIVEWQEIETEPTLSGLLKETINRIEAQGDNKFLVHQLRTPKELDDMDQLFVAMYLRQLAFSNKAPTSEIWEILKNDELRLPIFETFNEVALDTLLQAFLEMQLQEEDRWNYSLPHILAISANELSDDENRSGTLALYTVFCSLNVDAVGAIERLMVDSNDQRLTDLIKRWRDIFDAAKQFAPQWVRTRHRELAVLLHNH